VSDSWVVFLIVAVFAAVGVFAFWLGHKLEQKNTEVRRAHARAEALARSAERVKEQMAGEIVRGDRGKRIAADHERVRRLHGDILADRTVVTTFDLVDALPEWQRRNEALAVQDLDVIATEPNIVIDPPVEGGS